MSKDINGCEVLHFKVEGTLRVRSAAALQAASIAIDNAMDILGKSEFITSRLTAKGQLVFTVKKEIEWDEGRAADGTISGKTL